MILWDLLDFRIFDHFWPFLIFGFFVYGFMDFFVDFFRIFLDFFWIFLIFLGFLNFLNILDFFRFFFGFFLLLLLLNVTTVTNEHHKSSKMGQNRIKSSDASNWSCDLRANERPRNKLQWKGSYIRTLRLLDQLGPEGEVGENCWTLVF